MATPHEETNPYQPPQTVGANEYDPIRVFGSAEAMQRVATGLNLVYWGIAITLLSVIGGVVLLFASFGRSSITFTAIAVSVIALGVMVGVLVSLVGRIFCLAVPNSTGAKPMILAAVVLDLLGIGISIADIARIVPTPVSEATSLFSLAATLLFVVFMKRVAKFVGAFELANDAQRLIWMGIVIMLVAFAFGIFAALGQIAALAGIVILVMAILLVLRYIRLIVNLRKAILRRG